MLHKSLKAFRHQLSDAAFQLNVLNDAQKIGSDLPTFAQKLKESHLFPLKPTQLAVFQVNIGKMCNQLCKHCHVDAGPDRKEIMTQETMQQCLVILKKHPEFTTVDLTGGAPEMNPNFRWFVEEIRKISDSIKIIVRSNLTILRANPKYSDLPTFFKNNTVEVVSSLPAVTLNRTDAQRGEGVFEDSIKALQLLNEVGYGKEGTALILNLVHNPTGAFLPSGQLGIEKNFKEVLKKKYNIDFNHLFSITNIPISRYLEYLLESGNFGEYMHKLVDAYNPLAAANVMCRNTLSIGWDGKIYDCDFNQMLDLKVASSSTHITDFNAEALLHRNIIVNQHCFGCTAGAGSSCGGEVV